MLNKHRSCSSWFHIYQKSLNAKLRLFCFPYAGGSAGIFSNWHKYITPEVDIFALQAPGRQERFTEKPVSNINDLIILILNEIESFLDIPFVFIGHSIGALISFELARELQRKGMQSTKHLILSGARAAHIKDDEILYNLPSEEFKEKLQELGATPNEILDNEDLLELLTPLIRADFAIGDTYEFREDAKLKSDVTLFWANGDTDITKEETLAWQKNIEGNIDLIEFNGGHFFIHENEDRYISECNKVIKLILHSLDV